jgi:hypothetical protein
MKKKIKSFAYDKNRFATSNNHETTSHDLQISHPKQQTNSFFFNHPTMRVLQVKIPSKHSIAASR